MPDDALVAIQQRTSAILAARQDWPCRKGCDHCCRTLAAIPELTRPEWDRLRHRIRELPRDVHERILALTPVRPVVCPLLDPESAACLVYEQRPVACRAYGFYQERELGLYCESIALGVGRGEFEGVVWGNYASVKPRGESRDLLAWYREDVEYQQAQSEAHSPVR